MLGFYSSQAGAIVRWLDLPGRGDPVVFIHGLGCAFSPFAISSRSSSSVVIVGLLNRRNANTSVWFIPKFTNNLTGWSS